MAPDQYDVSAVARREAAERYRPAKVRLLLVAHAPPNVVERYFYFEDVREKDDLFRYVVQGLYGSKPERSEKRRWLGRLREDGVFLIDLMERPYDGSDLAVCVPGLIDRARQLDPEHIVLIKADVFDSACRRLRDAGLPVVDARMPFPTSGRQKEFEVAFEDALRTIGWTTGPA